MKRTPRGSSRRPGFSMVESLVAVAITAIAGGALLTSLGAAIQASSHATDAAMARGLAAQLMDEVVSARFPADFDVRAIDGTREYFDDLDDYHGWTSRPPAEKSGIPLGQDGPIVGGVRTLRTDVLRPDAVALSNFTREVVVERVEPNGTGGWSATAAATTSRRITVRVRYTDARSNSTVLSELMQIVSDVPVSP